MIFRTRKFFAFLLVGWLAASAFAHAETLVEYKIGPLGGKGTDRTSNPQAASQVAQHLSAGKLTPILDGEPSQNTRASGMGFLNNYGFVGANSFKPGLGDDYFSFTVDIAEGFEAEFGSLSFSSMTPRLDGVSAICFDVRSSADGFAKSLETVSFKESNRGTGAPSGAISLASMGKLGGQVEFRIYVYEEADGAAVSNEARIYDITVTGSVVPAGQ